MFLSEDKKETCDAVMWEKDKMRSGMEDYCVLDLYLLCSLLLFEPSAQLGEGMS